MQRICEGVASGHGDDPSPETHPLWHLPRILARFVLHRLHALTCTRCGAATKATLPPGVPQGRFCARLTAVVAVFAGAYRPPQRLIQTLVGELFGVPMSLGTVAKQEGSASAAMAPAVEEAHEHLKTQGVVHADETSRSIANAKGWLWVAATSTVAVFLARARRAAKVAKELLGETFGGLLVSDRWSGYNWVDTRRRQLCWLHLERQFEGFADHGRGGKRLSRAQLRQTRKMFRLWHWVRDGTLSRAAFQRKMQPAEQRIVALFEGGPRCAQRALAGRCREILKLADALFTFVRVEGVAPTNNHGERVLRHAVIWTKGCYGVDSEAGATFVGRVLTVVTTLRLPKRNVLDWMTEACEAHLARRVHIPKGSGSETRPIGISTFEDKVLQRAVAMILEAVYEQEFLPCSYGFRPGRSAHQALEQLWHDLTRMGGGWVLEIDVRKSFDALDHGHLRQILSRRVRDGVLLRLVAKWLHAGVMEEGHVSFPEAGSPQGGVISPILANVYLHEVLDVWVARMVQPRLRGQVRLIRYAVDATLIFAVESDGRRVLAVLPQRFAKYGLTLHPEKTRLRDCRQPDRLPPPGGGGRTRPETFDLLGFTHYWGRSRQGRWVVKRKTARDRFGRGLKRVAEWCRTHRHLPVGEQQWTLNQKLKGHFGYYGIIGNFAALHRFFEGVERVWRKWLDRRSQKAHIDWDRMARLLQRYPLAPPRILRPCSQA